MNVKNITLLSLFVGIGTVLYLIVPGYGGGMKPDFMVLMMCIGILLFKRLQETILISLATGILSGLLSTFPGGFLPNIIDKLVTGLLFLVIVISLKKLANNLFIGALLTGLGTIISGTIFLTAAILIADLNPETFGVLFVTVVLVTGLLNAITFSIIYPIINNILKRTKYIKE